VIKNAVKKSALPACAKHVQWFKLVVTGKAARRRRFHAPVSLV
jgi:hypothetical protein